MERERTRHFHEGLKYLDDIQKLSEENVSPLVRQAIFNFSRAIDNSRTEKLSLKDFSKIERFARSFVERHRQRILIRESISDVVLEFSTSEITLEAFDTILEALSLFTDIISLLPFQGRGELCIDNQWITFKADVVLSEEVEQLRVKLYALTRNILKKGMLMTFSHGKLTSGKASLTLKLRMPDSGSHVLLLDLERSDMPAVGMNSILADYCVHPNFLTEIGRHLCIEVTERLTVEKYYRLPKRVLSPDCRYEILHFAFLFRPVSLIIPRRCRLTAKADLKNLLGSNGESKRSYFDLDIISLMAD